jgi:excinuclease UvrABC nuclease subunit
VNIEEWVIPGAGQQFDGDDFRDLRRPGVYVFMFEGSALYVGMASMLLRRIGGFHKQAQDAIDGCDRVFVYPCVSLEAALELEKLLICQLKPRDNVNSRLNYIKQRLGIRIGSKLVSVAS